MMDTHPCAKIPKFDELRAQSELKEALLRETRGGDAFVTRAAQVILAHVLHGQPYLNSPRGSLPDTLHRHYTNEQIAHALARAWLDQTDHFLLPRRRLRDRLGSTKSLIAISILFALAIVITLTVTLRYVYPKEVAGFLAFEPLLAIIAVAVAAAIFWTLRQLHGWLR
jgi:hypothetical protein